MYIQYPPGFTLPTRIFFSLEKVKVIHTCTAAVHTRFVRSMPCTSVISFAFDTRDHKIMDKNKTHDAWHYNTQRTITHGTQDWTKQGACHWQGLTA